MSLAHVSFDYVGVLDAQKQEAKGKIGAKFEAGQLTGAVHATSEGVNLSEMVLAAAGHNIKGHVSAVFDPASFKADVNADGTDLNVSGTYTDVLSVAVKAGVVDLDKILGQASSDDCLLYTSPSPRDRG